jgi:hypothetical protein
MSSTNHAQCSTLHTQIEELIMRVDSLADTYRETPDSAIAADLDQAERGLVAARRALERAMHALQDR